MGRRACQAFMRELCKASAGTMQRQDAQGHKKSSRGQTPEPSVEIRENISLSCTYTLILPLFLPLRLLSILPFISLSTFVEHLLCSKPRWPQRYKRGTRHGGIFDFRESSGPSHCSQRFGRRDSNNTKM